MPTRFSKYLSTLHLIGDVILINSAYLTSYIFFFSFEPEFIRTKYFILLLIFNLSWISLTYLLRTYHLDRVEDFETIFISVLKLISIHLLLISSIIFIGNFSFSRDHILYTYLFLSAFIFLWRLGLLWFFQTYRKLGYNYRNVIILGYNEVAKELQKFFKRYPQHGYRFLGYFDNSTSNGDIKGNLEDVYDFVTENNVDEIYYSLSEVNYEYVNNLIDFADNHFIRVKVLTDFKLLPYKNFKIEFYDNLPILDIRTIPLDDLINRALKRSFDILFSIVILFTVLIWLIPIISILIRLDSKGPAFFRQKRSGKDNKDFWCYKFRTMRVNQDANSKQATKNDSRITRVGRFLRKTNIDELPQFFNVLIGNMSVVGPRPHMLKHTEEYSQIINKYMMRHFVKPGITGLAQIKGYRGETHDPILMKNRIKIDRFYIENWSFLLDLKIIIVTVFNMIRGDKNAY
ncbi:MAG TPA: undecaprenyl-phosphate glucose phosphotransferase [Cytophagales bacterium]|nr:undecaprenyl-phosphate glucose phosphotransferase [Cytophagales bacterium]